MEIGRNQTGPMTLDALGAGERAVVLEVGGKGALRQHFLDMGLIPGARIEFVKKAPLGDPLEYRIHGYELTLRRDDAAKIAIELFDESADHVSAFDPHLAEDDTAEHPGLGEGGRFHSRADENPLPEDALLTFALPFIP